MTIKFKNNELPIGEILGRVITIQKQNLLIKNRLLRAESNNVFKVGSLKTKKNAFKQFNLIEVL